MVRWQLRNCAFEQVWCKAAGNQNLLAIQQALQTGAREFLCNSLPEQKDVLLS